MQRIRVKICGITNEPDALAAVEAGADALGFVAYPQSKRHIDLMRAVAWVRHLPPFIAKVVVCVNPTANELKHWAAEFPVDAWQFHGDETPDMIKAAPPGTRIRALRVRKTLSREELLAWPVEAFLLDTPAPEYGGSGKTFDWSLAVAIKEAAHRPIILAGGLDPANVTRAIATVRPYAVDCSSGVEESPGKKDYAKLRDFIAACRG